MRTVILVPRRADNGHRDALWAWCRARWQRLMPDVRIYEGHHTGGPFNRSAAINRAARLADEGGRWDVALVIDSDVFLPIPNVRRAIASAAEGKVTWAHRRWRNIADRHLKRLLADPDGFGEVPRDNRDMDLFVDVTNPISWSCAVAVPRTVFEEMGGFDERFKGWGFEDGAWAALVRGLYRWDRVQGTEEELKSGHFDVYHLNHPRSEERIVNGESSLTASPDYIRNALLGRRYMVAAIRDHKAGDQPGEEHLSDEMVAIHVANLTRDDAKFLSLARRLRMPEAREWATWWPTLPELVEGAKAYHDESPSGSVTLVVTSGGTAQTWPARREYLRASLRSLSEQVSGPIVQRVVYADWPGEIRAELTEIVAEFGFYVAGEGHHGHTAMRQRMWTYLSNRAKGEYIFGAEDDFVYSKPVDLQPMIDTLATHPHLAQVALLRGPAYESERLRGGILGHPEEEFARVGGNGTSRLEHIRFWTNNPSLFRKSLTVTPWPASREDMGGKGSEVIFADALRRDPSVRFALWGSGEAWIEHVGEVRAGTGY